MLGFGGFGGALRGLSGFSSPPPRRRLDEDQFGPIGSALTSNPISGTQAKSTVGQQPQSQSPLMQLSDNPISPQPQQQATPQPQMQQPQPQQDPIELPTDRMRQPTEQPQMQMQQPQSQMPQEQPAEQRDVLEQPPGEERMPDLTDELPIPEQPEDPEQPLTEMGQTAIQEAPPTRYFPTPDANPSVAPKASQVGSDDIGGTTTNPGYQYSMAGGVETYAPQFTYRRRR